MEKPCFHEQLEALYERFGRDAGMLRLADVAAYLCVDRRTLLAAKGFPVRKIGKGYKVPVVGLARWMS